MGDDDQIGVVAFKCLHADSAKDLVEFIESGYEWVLDANASPATDERGKVTVFVEFERNNKLHTSIREMMKVVANVSTITEWQFEYYKGDGAIELSEDNLKSSILDNPSEYVLKYSQPKNENLDRVKQLAGL